MAVPFRESFGLTLFLFVLGGCSDLAGGVGFGGDADNYKQSPCACEEIEQKHKKQYVG